ncbi:MAG: DUF2802 domain-containing protein [Gammaproteobacteria bacterium]
MIDQPTMQVTLLGLSAISLIGLTIRLITTRRRVQSLSNEIVRLEDLLLAQGTAMAGITRSLNLLQDQQKSLAGQWEKRQQEVDDGVTVNGSQVYRQAINLAIGGVEPQELVERFGLSRGEAELMISFHQPGDQAA